MFQLKNVASGFLGHAWIEKSILFSYPAIQYEIRKKPSDQSLALA